jgi:hypothetical protein
MLQSDQLLVLQEPLNPKVLHSNSYDNTLFP